ncbi:hypothetical protein BG000_007822 [Podila horticola]|nr:hypothetical protein BG000_007822 [Podila horticola]
MDRIIREMAAWDLINYRKIAYLQPRHSPLVERILKDMYLLDHEPLGHKAHTIYRKAREYLSMTSLDFPRQIKNIPAMATTTQKILHSISSLE